MNGPLVEPLSSKSVWTLLFWQYCLSKCFTCNTINIPNLESIDFYQFSTIIEEGALLPRKIDTVWRIHSCTVCILGDITSPQMQSLWASCRIHFPSRHRKHHEPCSKTQTIQQVFETERDREKLQRHICMKRKKKKKETL